MNNWLLIRIIKSVLADMNKTVKEDVIGASVLLAAPLLAFLG
jgi:hypothetical protein